MATPRVSLSSHPPSGAASTSFARDRFGEGASLVNTGDSGSISIRDSVEKSPPQWSLLHVHLIRWVLTAGTQPSPAVYYAMGGTDGFPSGDPLQCPGPRTGDTGGRTRNLARGDQSHHTDNTALFGLAPLCTDVRYGRSQDTCGTGWDGNARPQQAQRPIPPVRDLPPLLAGLHG